MTETFEAVTAASVAASPATAATTGVETDRLFTLTPSRWLDLDKDCATFLHTALRHASGDQCKPVVIGNIEQMEAAVKNIQVWFLWQNFFFFFSLGTSLICYRRRRKT